MRQFLHTSSTGFIVIICLALTGQGVFAQQIEWAFSGGSEGQDNARGVAVDGASHVYVVGEFSHTAHFGIHSLTAAGGLDAFVARVSRSGAVEWVRSAGGTGNDRAQDVAVGPDGSVYVTGYFRGTATFGTITLTSAGGNDMFLARYTPDGSVAWVRRAGGSETPNLAVSGDDHGFGVSVSSDGSVYLTGSFFGTADFEGTYLTSKGAQDIFTARYDSDGMLLWVRQAGGYAAQSDEGNDLVAYPGGGVAVTGFFGGTAYFDPLELHSAGIWDIFVAKYDADGNVVWATRAGGPWNDRGLGIASDPEGNLYLSGYFKSTADFGGFSMTAPGERDMFIARLTSGGEFVWAAQAAASEFGGGADISVDPKGLLLATFSFEGSMSHPGFLEAVGDRDVAVVAFEQDGDEAWARSFGGPGFDWRGGIALDRGDAYVVGAANENALFGDIDPVQFGGEDVFVANLYFGVQAPVLTYPPDGATGLSTTLNLSWEAAERADRYDVQIATAPGFGEILLSYNTPETTMQFVAPVAGHTFYWRVRGVDMGARGPWSSTFQFTVGATGPLAATPLSPANDQTDVNLDPVLSWTPGPQAVSHRLQISLNPNFSPVVLDEMDIQGGTFAVRGLGPGMTYFWRVAGVGSDGSSTYSRTQQFTTTTAPGVVTLLQPDDGAASLPTTLDLRWAAADRAARYDVHLATSADFAEILVSHNTPGTTMQFVAPVAGHTYYWRVRGVKSGLRGPWSAVFRLTVGTSGALAATSVSPADGEAGVDLDPTLRWTVAPEAVSYRLQLSLNMNFAPVMLDQKDIVGDSFPVTGLQPGTTYYWRVAGIGSDGSSTFSMTSRFTTTTAPGAVSLLEPPDGATSLPTTLNLRWAVTERAERYDVNIATTPDFAEILQSHNTPGTTMPFVAPAVGQTYYWRVRGINSAERGPWSSVFSFTVGTSGALAATLVWPADGETGVDLNPTLRWSAAPEAVSHQLQLSLDPRFTSVIVDQADIVGESLGVTALQAGTTYHWRVAGVGSDGSFTLSTTWRFTTIAVPGAVSLLEPTDGATSVSPNVTFTWDPVSEAETYQLQVSSDEALANTIIDQMALSSTAHTAETPLVYGEMYYWRVRAENAAGRGPWSPVRSFSVAVGTDVEEDIPLSLQGLVVFPNPIRDRASVQIGLARDTEIRLEIFDILGRRTRMVKEASLPAGTHTIALDSSALPNGMYMIELYTKEGRKDSGFLVVH